MIGQTISHYKILEKLGEGGMGVVYKAQDTTLDRFVALKFLPERLASSEQDRARFLQEAKAASALNHPNICTIHGIEEHSGQMFIVMELVEGQTLTEKKTSISFKQAIDIGIQLAEGLALAHEKGIVHRDIKPDNIMIRKDGIVQIMDFGLAKLRGVSRLTREGSTVGTAGYMSPEQVQGQDSDHRSDIFSFGVIMYDLIGGQLPFRGVHETALLYEIVNVDPVPLSAIKTDINPDLERIIMDCLEKDPEDRVQSVKEVARELKRFKKDSTRSHPSRVMSTQTKDQRSQQFVPIDSAPRWKRALWPALSAGLTLITAALIWRSLGNDRKPAPVIKFSLNFTASQQVSASLAVSPDGKYIAYIANRDDGIPMTYLRRLDALTAEPVAGTEGASDVFFSPDSKWLAFVSDLKLKKISIQGGSAIALCGIQNYRGGSWGTDSTIVFAPDIVGGLWQISVYGGQPKPVSTIDSASGEVSHRFPQVLVGGKAMIYTVKTVSILKFSEARIAVQSLQEKHHTTLFDGGAFARYAPSGHIIYAQNGSVLALPFDLDRLKVSGNPVRLMEGGFINEGSGNSTYGFSETGTLVYSPEKTALDDRLVVTLDRRGKETMIITRPGTYQTARFSNDRSSVVLCENAANDDIWIYDISRQIQTRLTYAGGNNSVPLWTPDGKKIAYSAERGGPPNLFLKFSDGTGTEERLAQNPFSQFPSSWHPDGQALAFDQTTVSGASDIWILSMTGDRKTLPFIQTPFDEFNAVFSPDGRWVTYTSNTSGQYEIYVVPFPQGEGKWQVSTNGGENSAWSNDGKEIVYIQRKSNLMMRVPVTLNPAFRPGKPEELFKIPNDISALAFGGEQWIAIKQGEKSSITQLNVIVNWFNEISRLTGEKK